MVFNAVVYLVAVLLGVGVLAAWIEPTFADWVILKLRARAAGVRASREAYRTAKLAVYRQEVSQ